jgi:hypothetical protein
MEPDNITSTPISDPKAANRAKFELELEFVQALANPFYLHSLAQQNVLEQPAFINFLEYLLYFKEKDYARFIQYARRQFVLSCCLTALSPKVILTPFIILNCSSMPISDLR